MARSLHHTSVFEDVYSPDPGWEEYREVLAVLCQHQGIPTTARSTHLEMARALTGQPYKASDPISEANTQLREMASRILGRPVPSSEAMAQTARDLEAALKGDS